MKNEMNEDLKRENEKINHLNVWELIYFKSIDVQVRKSK